MSDDSSTLNRRNFMKAGAGTAASMAGLTALGRGLDEGNDYENILYGPHREDSEPYDPGELSDDIDGLFLENSGDYMQHPVAHLEDLRSRPQYEKVIDEIAEQDKPIYFGDVNLDTDAQLAETGLMAGQAGLGAALAAKAGLGEDFTKTDAGLTGIAGWLLQPFAKYTAFMGSDEEVDFIDESNNVHPESYALTRGLRNAVVAYKQNELEGEFGTVWGSLHTGFEDRLEESQSSLESSIDRYSSLGERFIGNRDTISRAVELQSDERNEWYVEEVHEFPELEDVV